MNDECIYPNWEGDYTVDKHIFGKDDYCTICGHKKEMVKLHIGCGARYFGPDWINIDGANFDHILYHNVKTLYAFKDNTVDLIYSSHLISYFDREEIISILKEWHRVLKPNGILRLAVPDFEAMAKLYVENKCNLQQIIGPLYGRMPMNEEYIYHKTTYDKFSLTNILINSGFKEIENWNWKQMINEGYKDDSSRAHLPHNEDAIKNQIFDDTYTLISLNLECKKL